MKNPFDYIITRTIVDPPKRTEAGEPTLHVPITRAEPEPAALTAKEAVRFERQLQRQRVEAESPGPNEDWVDQPAAACSWRVTLNTRCS
jgi:hypothetical protein